MEVIKAGKIMTDRETIMNIKKIYDIGGPDACGRVFLEMLKLNQTVGFANHVEWLIRLVYKMDTCTSSCFENLESKKMCTCLCNNESIVIPFDNVSECIGKG